MLRDFGHAKRSSDCHAFGNSTAILVRIKREMAPIPNSSPFSKICDEPREAANIRQFASQFCCEEERLCDEIREVVN